MFYSHEILTSRKHGVATVWLVATLGSNSGSKKINRKAILEVDVPKACRTITNPAAPLALRLQGSLLYGVSRVYLQQVGYVLSDAQNAYSSMHMLLRTVKNAALDPEAGKARPEQLVLQDDPSFLPEFALPPPELLANLNLGPAIKPLRNGDSQSLTPFGSQQDPSTPEGRVGGLILPASSSVAAGDFVVHCSAGLRGPSDMFGGDELDDPGFGFDDEGNLIDYEPANVNPATPAAPGGSAVLSDDGASARVRQEHEEGLQAAAQHFSDQMDIDLPVYSDDLPEGEAFPTISPQQHDVPEAEQFSSPTVVAASQRKKRAPRTIPLDVTMELRNKDLADWNTNYLENMKEAARHKDQARLSRLAKKNAEHYVWGAGIGGIGARLPGVNGPSPFDHFIGDNLFELFTGINLKGAAGTKRDCDSGIDDATQEESRRVRQRTEEPEGQVGRGQDDEAMFMPQGEDVELPREAPSALDDQQMLSAMPWNLSASIRGSSVVPRSTRTGLGGSTGLHGRGGSRMTSASPLKGYGQSGGLQPLEGGDDGFGSFGDFDFGGPGPSSDRPDPAAAPPNARVREALSAEGQNFLGFVADAIDEKREQVQAAMSDPLQAEAAGSIDEVSFEELLPFHENTKTVAAQALMMTLTLGTKSLLDVRQAEAYDEITISLTATAKAARLAVLAGEQDDAEDDGGDERMEDDLHADEEEQEQGGQFAEQLAAGLAEREDDEEQEEVDSLYEG